MVTCFSKCGVGQKRPAKMRIECLQTHKRELFGPQRTVSVLVHDKAVDTPRPGFGSNKVLLSPVGPTKFTQVSLRLGPLPHLRQGIGIVDSLRIRARCNFTILPETAFTTMIQRANEEPSTITLTFHDDLVYHNHAIV